MGVETRADFFPICSFSFSFVRSQASLLSTILSSHATKQASLNGWRFLAISSDGHNKIAEKGTPDELVKEIWHARKVATMSEPSSESSDDLDWFCTEKYEVNHVLIK